MTETKAEAKQKTQEWQCGHCDKVTAERRHWCILWGPVSRKRPRRVVVCAECKAELGKYC